MTEKIEGQPCADCQDGKYVKNPKTGKIFCDKKCWLEKDGTAPQPAQEKVDWEKISIGKVRHGITCAYIQSGLKELDADTANEITKITKYVMTGVHPDVPFNG